MRRQVNSLERNRLGMAEDHFLNPAAIAKQGSDTIFSWWARYQDAVSSGKEPVNATIGALLEDDGTLAINKIVDSAVRNAPSNEIASYAPLAGLPDFLDLAKTLALGDFRKSIDDSGFHLGSTATPGGSGALYLAANNFLDEGQSCMLRDRHWGPYKGFLKNNGLSWSSWPLLPKDKQGIYPYFAQKEFEKTLDNLCSKQNKVMVWLNDPAHNPTGLSMTSDGRKACLESFVTSALRNEHVGHTLLIDLAYSLYAEDPYGWAETISESIESGMLWPENLLITFAISLSKSHTIYGLRTGALVSLHPEEEVVKRLETVMSVTGRQTWSAAPRIAQYCVSQIHSNQNEGLAWENERDRLRQLLVKRRSKLVSACDKLGVPLNPTMDGFFAWIEVEDPLNFAESCAKENVFVVPLDGGVRIALCALSTDHVERVAGALHKAMGD